MRVIESVGFYFPDSSGGSEVYVSNLAKCLQQMPGISCTVAAPSGSGLSHYSHEGTSVFRYPVPTDWFRSEAQGKAPPREFGVFEDWLAQQQADVYHQHSWTTACGLWHLKAAKRLGLKTVVTVHVPANICLRGTMLLEGLSACDGEIQAKRCAACWLQSRGIAANVSHRLAALPQCLAPLVRLPRLGPALAAKTLVENHKAQLHHMARTADRIVAVCSWLRDALIANGIPPDKVVLNRQGVEEWTHISALGKSSNSSKVLRIGFLGRCDPLKGPHVLAEALEKVPADVPVQVEFCTAGTSNEAEKYRNLISRFAARDRRIRVNPEVLHSEVGDFFNRIDVLAVPSQWLETGPLVVLEAFAAGIPVIGSNLGGIKELVGHELNGLLVPHSDIGAWTAAIVRLAMDRSLLARLSKGVGPVRTMSDVAHDMASLYLKLCANEKYAA